MKVGELTEPMAEGYILGPDVNQDPGGNINKSGMIWPIDNTTANHHIFLLAITKITGYLSP